MLNNSTLINVVMQSRYAEFRLCWMSHVLLVCSVSLLIVIMLSAVMLSVYVLNAITLRVVMLSIVRLNEWMVTILAPQTLK
jgi:hypothetical protein